MKRLTALTAFVILTLIFTQPGFGQTSEELRALKDEIKALKAGQTAIQKELQEIKSLLRSRPAQPEVPRDIVLNIDGVPFKGDKDARLVLVDFSEYQ